MVTDTVADVLTRIRNAQLAGHKTVAVPLSSMVKRFLAVLASEGFVDEIKESVSTATGFGVLDVGLRYLQDGRPLISKCTRVSKPGRRVYAGCDSLKQRKSGLGIAVVSTSKGVMSDRQAKRLGIGGEVLAIIG